MSKDSTPFINPHFRVIIVGGGPIGLTTALALSKAGIDFTVLEQRKTFGPNLGASIGFWPHGMRVLGQLGVLEKLQALGHEVRHVYIQDFDGYIFNDTSVFETVGKK